MYLFPSCFAVFVFEDADDDDTVGVQGFLTILKELEDI